MRVLETSIEITASPEQVWQVLTDFDSYPDWNPFVTSISGVAEAGQQLVVRLQPPGGRGMTMRPRVQSADRARRFAWLGRLGVPGVFDGAHEFLIDGRDGTTTFTQRETFRGALVPFTGRLLARTKLGFEAMNAALKDRAERA
jgi:hypothetical protein